MATLNASPEKINAALTVIRTVAASVREAGSIPAGHLYAAMMTHGCTLAQYETIERILVDSGLVSKSGDVLTWRGN